MVPLDGKYNLYKFHTWAFWLPLTVFKIFIFQILWPWKCRSRSWWTALAVAPFDFKYLTSYLMALVIFAFFERLLVKVASGKVWPWKFREKSPKWSNSIENINLFKLYTWQFFAITLRLRDINIWNVWPWKSWSRSRSTTLAMLPPDIRGQIYKRHL